MKFGRNARGVAAVSMLAFGVWGCGGGGHVSLPDNGGSNDTVEITGGVVPVSATTTTDIPASDTPGLTLLTLPGSASPTEVALATGDAIPAGTPLVVIPAGTSFISGLTGGARNSGDILINGKLIRSKVVNGQISPAIALPSGRYTMAVEGPYNIKQGSVTLTTQGASFQFDCNGRQLSLPTGLTGKIPANGSDNWKNSVAATFSSDYSTGTASLTIVHANGTMAQTRTASNGAVTFHDFSEDARSHIPVQGVQSINLVHLGD